MGKETLTPKQRLFCYEYVLDHNGKRSYQAAYPNCKAARSAESQASRLLRNDKVKKFIADLEKRKSISLRLRVYRSKQSKVVKNGATQERNRSKAV